MCICVCVWMGNLHQSPQIIEGTLLTVCSGRPAERTDQEEEEEENVGPHKRREPLRRSKGRPRQ